VILDQDLASLLLTTLTNQPSRAFRHDEDSKKLDTRHEALQSSRQNPLQSTSLVSQRTKADPRRNDASKIPQGIVNGRDLASVSRMRNLGDEKRASRVGDVGAAAHDESTDEVQSIAFGTVASLRKALHECSDYDNDAAHCCAFLATETVGDVGGEEEDEETAETGHGAEDTKTTSFGVIED